ncbi:MAG TPA: cell-division initiation protein [Lachnospiraceae bacterium]|nr:cell-division initiation protein [Lachnospiraceae bacterium]
MSVSLIVSSIRDRFVFGGVVLNNKNKRRRRRTSLYLVVVLVIIFVVTMGVHGMNLSADCDKLSAEQTELETRKKELEEEREEIKNRSEYMKTDAYIEDVAREKFGLAYDDEIIFKAAESE